jgi:hypothetical protein
MDEVEKPAERFSQRLLGGIAGSDNRVLEHSLDAETGERCTRGKNTLFWIANQNRSERPQSHLMRLEYAETPVQGEDEAVAPSPWRHLRRLTRVLRRQFVVERDDDRLLAREVAIQESDADARFLRDIPKGGRFITAGCDQLHRCGIEAIPRHRALRGLAGRAAAFSRLDILSEHVH